jgi:hypothetical protein
MTSLSPLTVAIVGVITALVTALGGWLAAKAQKKIRVNFDGIEVEANNIKEAFDLLGMIKLLDVHLSQVLNPDTPPHSNLMAEPAFGGSVEVEDEA